jgi:hypothetical protein
VEDIRKSRQRSPSHQYHISADLGAVKPHGLWPDPFLTLDANVPVNDQGPIAFSQGLRHDGVLFNPLGTTLQPSPPAYEGQDETGQSRWQALKQQTYDTGADGLADEFRLKAADWTSSILNGRIDPAQAASSASQPPLMSSAWGAGFVPSSHANGLLGGGAPSRPVPALLGNGLAPQPSPYERAFSALQQAELQLREHGHTHAAPAGLGASARRAGAPVPAPAHEHLDQRSPASRAMAAAQRLLSARAAAPPPSARPASGGVLMGSNPEGASFEELAAGMLRRLGAAPSTLPPSFTSLGPAPPQQIGAAVSLAAASAAAAVASVGYTRGPVPGPGGASGSHKAAGHSDVAAAPGIELQSTLQVGCGRNPASLHLSWHSLGCTAAPRLPLQGSMCDIRTGPDGGGQPCGVGGGAAGRARAPASPGGGGG